MQLNFSQKSNKGLKKLQDLKTEFSESKLALPNISSKVGTLRTFLSLDDFRKTLQTLPEDSKFQSGPSFRKKSHKIFITMNEELSSASKKEPSSLLNDGQEEQIESKDERKKLLYDKHIIHRQKAAINICNMIVDEIKQKFGYVDHAEDSEKSSNESDDSDSELSLNIEKLKKKTKDLLDLPEKLDKVLEIHKKYFSKNLDPNKKKLNFKNELIPGEFEETTSHESNMHRISKSKEKIVREDVLFQSGDLFELFPEEPYFSFAHKSTYEQFSKKIPNLPIINDPEVCQSMLIQRVELNSPSQKQNKSKKVCVTVNRNCISLPGMKIDSNLGLYITQYFTGYRSLIKVDISGNPIGDKIGALFVYCLDKFSEGLEYLDLSSTQISILTSQALQTLLKSTQNRLQHLKLENNLIRDEGLCAISISLLSNTSLLFINIADNKIELAGGYTISKVIRINRTLAGINISKSSIAGKGIRELCRSMIVNTEIKSLIINACELTDEDAKEIGHMLNVNSRLQQLGLCKNKFSHKGLDYLKYGLPKNKTLVHLALSGNKSIKLSGLERIKNSMPKTVEIDIEKEDDFFKTPEAKKLKLLDYIS